MNSIKVKAIKYTILLIVIFILQPLFPLLVSLSSIYFEMIPSPKAIGILITGYNFLLNIGFALILFLDSRKEIENYILVPLLCVFAPLVGLVFYFTAILFETRKQIQ